MFPSLSNMCYVEICFWGEVEMAASSCGYHATLIIAVVHMDTGTHTDCGYIYKTCTKWNQPRFQHGSRRNSLSDKLTEEIWTIYGVLGEGESQLFGCWFWQTAHVQTDIFKPCTYWQYLVDMVDFTNSTWVWEGKLVRGIRGFRGWGMSLIKIKCIHLRNL